MSLAFIIFQEYPKTMSAINSQLMRVELLLSKTSHLCLSRRMHLSNESLKQVDEALELVDAKIGEFGLVSIGEFIADIIEVFCHYSAGRVNTDVSSINRTNEHLEKMLAVVGWRLKAANVDYDFPERRINNWSLLPLTKQIQVCIRIVFDIFLFKVFFFFDF